MKTILLLITCLILSGLFFPNILSAQSTDNKQTSAPLPDTTQIKEIVAMLASELSLIKEQAQQLKQVFIIHFTKLKQELNNERITGETHWENMKALHAEFDIQINEILNPEQQLKYAEFFNHPKTEVMDKKRPL